MLAVLKKELKTYFTSMTGYIFLGFFVMVTGIFYTLYCVMSLSGQYSAVLSSGILVFLLLVPTITMRLIAEETRQKTDQLLYTSPITVGDVVIGKYLAALVLFLVALGITVIFPVLLSKYGTVPFVETFGTFVAFYLIGACFIAVGLFISSLTENQIVSAVATFGALFAMYLMDGIAQSLPTSRIASVVFAIILVLALAFFVYSNVKNLYAAVAIGVVGTAAVIILYAVVPTIFDGLLVNVFGWFSVMKRFNNFYYGIFDVASIVYYLSFAAIFVYLTIQVIEKRRWS